MNEDVDFTDFAVHESISGNCPWDLSLNFAISMKAGYGLDGMYVCMCVEFGVHTYIRVSVPHSYTRANVKCVFPSGNSRSKFQ